MTLLELAIFLGPIWIICAVVFANEELRRVSYPLSSRWQEFGCWTKNFFFFLSLPLLGLILLALFALLLGTVVLWYIHGPHIPAFP
jgi:hypothetical protein